MRTAVERQTRLYRRGAEFSSDGLNAWFKVTVLRLKSCGLGEGGGRALAEHCASTPRSRRSTLASICLERSEGGRWAEPLRFDTTLTLLSFSAIVWERVEGGRRAETLRLNTRLASLYLERGRGTAPQHHGYVAQP